MKQTAKKRALRYIRQKNRIRKGGVLRDFFKLESHLIEDKKYFEYSFKSIYNSEEYYSKIFKLNIELHSFDVGLDGDDFIKGLKTIRLTYKLKT